MKFKFKHRIVDAIIWNGDNLKEIKTFCEDAGYNAEKYEDKALYVTNKEIIFDGFILPLGYYIINHCGFMEYSSVDEFEQDFKPVE